MELLAEMQQLGLAPNSIPYGAVVIARVKDKLPLKTIEFLAEIRQQGLAPNAITYSAAFSACEKAKQPHWVMEHLFRTQQKGLGQTPWTSMHWSLPSVRRSERPPLRLHVGNLFICQDGSGFFLTLVQLTAFGVGSSLRRIGGFRPTPPYPWRLLLSSIEPS